MLKAILKNERVRSVLCWLVSLYIRFVYRTSRWQVRGAEKPRALWDARQPFILCFWHNRLLMMPYCWDYRHAIHMMASKHRDGQFIANAASHFGIQNVTGSSAKGPSWGLRTMLRQLGSGECVGLIPDGPRGPRMRAHNGVVTLARLSGVPILPATYSISRRRVIGSWDRFLLALPFARGAIIWGEPITVPRDADDAEQELARRRVESDLTAISHEADRLCGQPEIEPAPEPQESAS